MTGNPIDVDGQTDTRELRLAIVLYGGVSLAIYMHGTTKELHRLVRASALADRDANTQRTPSETVYDALLTELAQRHPQKVRTRVVVDVIAGTSAGGINGVYLAKALAHNRSQESLRDLWLERGDIKQLLRLAPWLPMWIKVPVLLVQSVKQPPLQGDAIARWMYQALQTMDAADGGQSDLESLVSTDNMLELFVTTTDFSGYERDLVINDPRLIHDHTHRHVFCFRYGDGADDFTPADNAGLALAARSTMSFPGAFPPVSLQSFQHALAPATVDLSHIQKQLFRSYQLSSANPELTHFIDGGVLDNRPFRHAIEAIKQRPADTEVERRLLYLEPDPAIPGAAPTYPEATPSPLATVLAAVSGIPRKEPIIDDILDVQQHNERVRRVRDVIEMTFAPIAERVNELVQQLAGTPLAQFAEIPSADVVDLWRGKLADDAQSRAGLTYTTYIRSKVSGVVDRYASTICRICDFPDDSNQAAFVRAVLHAWARERLFTQRDGQPVAVDDQVAFLRTFDLDYGVRRIDFVISALSWWYDHIGEPGYPTRAQLNQGKRTLYKLRDELLNAAGVGTTLREQVLVLFGQEPIDTWVYQRGLGPVEYLGERQNALAQLEAAVGTALNTALAGFGMRLFEAVHTIGRDLSPERRADLLVRYLGFPYWDIMLYPFQSISDTRERDAIEVVRMSPLDAHLLEPLDKDKPKLAGVGVLHFGAFFDRAGRENDYLWGRLDGAERLIGLLLGTEADPQDHKRWCRQAFEAIVQEEQSALSNAKALLNQAHEWATA